MSTIKHTISYDEYELMKYDLLKLHNKLTDYSARLTNDRVNHRINEVRYALKVLLDELKSQNIIE